MIKVTLKQSQFNLLIKNIYTMMRYFSENIIIDSEGLNI